MSEIKPALSVEDWRAALHRGDYEYFADSEDDISGHGKAALYLYGQPFGFNRHDVEFLRHFVVTSEQRLEWLETLEAVTSFIELRERKGRDD